MKRAHLDKQGNNRWHSEVWKAKLFINRWIACNNDLNAKENSAELTVSASHKLI